jgi:hypothetical protein
LSPCGPLFYCADCRCSHSIAISGDPWPDHLRLTDIGERFACSVCGKRGADVRPDFNWKSRGPCWAIVEGLLIQGKPRFLANF